MDLYRGAIAGCVCLAFIASQTCELHGQKVESPDSVGYMVQGNGTASGTTISGVRSYERIPVTGQIPQLEIALNYGAFNMELKGEKRNG